MRIKLDENLPIELASHLQALGHDADTVPQEGLVGRLDRDVWAAAQQGARFFITQDLDFSDIRQFAPGTHFGLLLVRLTSPTRRALIRHVRTAFESEDVELWARAFVVLTQSKIRVRQS